METETKKAERGNPCKSEAPIIDSGLTSEKGCDNFRCISQENGKCLHDAPCVPCDRDGNTFTVLPVIDAEAARHQFPARLFGENNPMKRPENRAKISAARKGKPLSVEHRKKLSIAHTGKHLSEDHKRKLSESLTGRTGHKWSDVERKERSESYIGRFRGADNPTFKGDDVSYAGLHLWVNRNIPKPEICSRCGQIPLTGRIEAHNISGEYKRDPEDWIYLCTSCHQEIDGRKERLIQKRPFGPIIDSDESNAALALCNELTRGKVLHQILNSDNMDEALRLVRVLKGHKRPVVTEEPIPTPHPFLDIAFLKLKAVR